MTKLKRFESTAQTGQVRATPAITRQIFLKVLRLFRTFFKCGATVLREAAVESALPGSPTRLWRDVTSKSCHWHDFPPSPCTLWKLTQILDTLDATARTDRQEKDQQRRDQPTGGNCRPQQCPSLLFGRAISEESQEVDKRLSLAVSGALHPGRQIIMKNGKRRTWNISRRSHLEIPRTKEDARREDRKNTQAY
jgi:hypothetical protein